MVWWMLLFFKAGSMCWVVEMVPTEKIYWEMLLAHRYWRTVLLAIGVSNLVVCSFPGVVQKSLLTTIVCIRLAVLVVLCSIVSKPPGSIIMANWMSGVCWKIRWLVHYVNALAKADDYLFVLDWHHEHKGGALKVSNTLVWEKMSCLGQQPTL